VLSTNGYCQGAGATPTGPDISSLTGCCGGEALPQGPTSGLNWTSSIIITIINHWLAMWLRH
jgi:hypothetical protein